MSSTLIIKIKSKEVKAMVSGGFEFAAEATTALAAFGTRGLKWAVFRIPEGSDSGCELVASSPSSGEGEE